MPFRIKPYFLCLIILVSFFAGCKKDTDPASPSATKMNLNYTLKPDSIALIAVNDIHVSASRDGLISNSSLLPDQFYVQSNTQVHLSNAGLWVSAVQDNAPRANLNIGGFSNYTSKWDGNNLGVFHITPEILKNNISNWPAQYGAPVDQNGNPAIYGDEMLFSCLKGTVNPSQMALNSPIENLRVTQSVYAYQRSDLKNVIFIRYELKNMGSKDLNDVFAGFYSDVDINTDQVNNAIGYDAASGMTYTYFNPKDPNSSKFINCVSGNVFLESPVSDSRFPYSVTGHRMIERDYGAKDSQFGELLGNAVQALNVLKALGNDGSSMIDPVTNTPTIFAFTGNPLTGTGWLDQSRDSRNMITTGPFNLKASESRVITVAMVTAGEKELGASLNKLKSQIDLIRNERSLWSFPVSKQ